MTPAGERPCYYLVGSTGFPNYGDELVAATWLRHLAAVAPDADVWLDCQEPASAAVLLDGLHPRARFVDTLWRLCRAAPDREPWQIAAWVQRAIRDPGMAPRWVIGVELLARAQVVHLIGGGYITDLWPDRLGLLAGAAAAAARSGGRAVMTGQGLAPATADTEALLRALVERFDVVDVRDRYSLELAGGGAVLSCDDVFLGIAEGLADVVDPTAGAPSYMLCLQADATEVSSSRLAADTLDVLRAWEVAPEQVGVVEGIPGLDREVYALLEHQLPGATFYPFSAVWERGLPLHHDQTWISTRFHFHLLAAAAGARGVAVAVHPDYYTAKHQSLIDLGSGWELRDPISAAGPPHHPSGGGFPADVRRRCGAEKAALARSIYPAPAAAPANGHRPSGAAAGSTAEAVGPRSFWARISRARPEV
ncbi:polysaccharide pyruvyl transferase family protein [Pseudonocardia asaccharolytica]|uniref:Polysaccharide pyruvyl transferase domain-containing protein n=1 Tax=Pseudonocardia asaccharolytica DSM 44247 = NBRC 16224 TaxID=1123024 RepID=A0A511CZM7_9PSEU|nr:polysaccharide pyruvyl transferase family protein [Pseudonocardia asaccharolytica]GEL17917.1 hypothetical protein PA7_17540 [Pseudonocardia asaccharolytica DSM 44247 = NBRC 16224]